jgi:two-component system OmpR family response regulator/two-component system response regulator QseB
VVVITARDTLHDRIKGLDLGADDYLVKPFDLEELSARVRAAIRRGAHQPSVTLRHGLIELDPVSKKVQFDAKPVSLTAREFAVLRALMVSNPNPLSRAQLEAALYSWGEEVESNAIEVHVHHLRKKLGSGLIVTVRHHGYALSGNP